MNQSSKVRLDEKAPEKRIQAGEGKSGSMGLEGATVGGGAQNASVNKMGSSAQ